MASREEKDPISEGIPEENLKTRIKQGRLGEGILNRRNGYQEPERKKGYVSRKRGFLRKRTKAGAGAGKGDAGKIEREAGVPTVRDTAGEDFRNVSEDPERGRSASEKILKRKRGKKEKEGRARKSPFKTKGVTAQHQTLLKREAKHPVTHAKKGRNEKRRGKELRSSHFLRASDHGSKRK